MKDPTIGQRIVYTAGEVAYPGTVVRCNSEFRDDYWFIDWDDGSKIGHSFDQSHFIALEGEK